MMFIVFEGPEGSGKSTQLARLAEQLRHKQHTVTLTKEPGGPPTAHAVRQVLLDPELSMTPLCEFLLYSASRCQNVQEVIKPALARGETVLCDRFFASSIAYQGYGRGVEMAFIHELTERVTEGIVPDLTLLLDIDPAQGLARIAARGEKDRLERADLAFHQRVRQGFLAQAQNRSDWAVFDAMQTPDALQKAIWQTLTTHAPSHFAER